MKWVFYIGSLLIVIIQTGCASYNIITPIFPASVNPGKDPQLVTSLQPLLSWQVNDENVVSYDLIIFEILVDTSVEKNIKRTIGGKVYYRENISGNSHLVQVVLKPDAEYCWSLRMRAGNVISEWASYDYRFLVLTRPKVNDSYYRFKTPYLRPLTFKAFDPLDHW